MDIIACLLLRKKKKNDDEIILIVSIVISLICISKVLLHSCLRFFLKIEDSLHFNVRKSNAQTRHLYTHTHTLSRKFPSSFLFLFIYSYFSLFFFKKKRKRRKELLGFLGTDLLAQQCPDEGKRMLLVVVVAVGYIYILAPIWLVINIQSINFPIHQTNRLPIYKKKTNKINVLYSFIFNEI